MGSATATFLSSRCSMRSHINHSGTRAPSFVTVRASAAAAGAGKDKNKSAVATSNYMVPLDKLPTGITRPLVEILRDLNKRVPDNIISKDQPSIPCKEIGDLLRFENISARSEKTGTK